MIYLVRHFVLSPTSRNICFGRCLTLLAALVLGALLVLAHDIVGIVHQFVVVRAIVGVAVDLV